jgi:hypothetical protein
MPKDIKAKDTNAQAGTTKDTNKIKEWGRTLVVGCVTR